MTTQTANRSARRLPEAMLGHDISGATDLADALRQANLDWTINDVPAEDLFLSNGDDIVTTSIPGRRLLMRSDNNTTLGVVGNRYTTVDNADAFALADYAQSLGARFAYAGETDHGRETFLTLDIPEARVHVGGLDVVDFGVVLRNNTAGTGSIIGEVTGTRLVCTNGMTVGVNAGSRWAIRHTRGAHTALEEARATLQHAFQYAKEFAAHADNLISTPYTVREFEALVEELFTRPDAEVDSARKITTWERRRDELASLFRSAETQEDGRNTAWGALNAVIEWDQWYRPARGGQEGRATRNFSNSDSSGVAGRALSLLTA